MMKFIFVSIIILFSIPVLSSPEITGKFVTVSESDCNSEIHFYENGEGEFIDYCLKADGTYKGEVYRDRVTWRRNNNNVVVNINGLDEIFTVYDQLSCKYFGDKGYAHGLIGMDLYFWKKPVACN